MLEFTTENLQYLFINIEWGQKKISPVSCFPTVPKFYPPTLNFLWPRIKLHTKTFFLDIHKRKNMYMEQF
jgi:hypothetical protein